MRFKSVEIACDLQSRVTQTKHFSPIFLFVVCVRACRRHHVVDDVTMLGLDYFLLRCLIVQVGAEHLSTLFLLERGGDCVVVVIS